MLSLLLASANGHGNMVWPATWFDPNGAHGAESYGTCATGGCMWFTNNTFVKEITMPRDSEAHTYRDIITGNTPWNAPGSAMIYSPCGVQGGNPDGCPVGASQKRGDQCPGGGSAYGPKAEKVYYTELRNILSTKWKSGSVVEAHWGIQANHGGGYQYRLCKVPEAGVKALTEECFQNMPLEFATDKSWIQHGKDVSTRQEFKAFRINTGTMPKNSTWARNPIPACAAPDGGVFTDVSDECQATGGKAQFPAPVPGAQGFGEYVHSNPPFAATFDFNIVDKLQLPELEKGKYVLSFRWDCEQTPQVWNTCSDIEIV